MAGTLLGKNLVCGCLGALLLGGALQAQAAVYHVTSNADSGAGTLRTAIVLANLNPGPDTVFFNLPLSDLDITLTTDLPEITDLLTIVGASQPGFTKVPLVTLRSGGSLNGLRVAAAGTSVSGLRVTGFQTGISVTAPSCTIASCHVVSNAISGIQLNADGATISGCYVAASHTGIRIQSGNTNSLFGNFIGLHPSTGTANANSHGIMILSGRQFIGGTDADEGNVISGNTIAGISIGDSSHSNSIRGNIIGANASGSTAVPNGIGIGISGNYNQVGDIKSGGGNLISGNSSAGMVLEGFTAFCAFNRVQGNVIGTDLTGTFAIPNGTGIVIRTHFAYSNTVGSALAGARNLISGNSGPGIHIHEAQGTSLRGNYIGTDALGTAALPNGSHGVYVEAAPRTTIGGTGAGAGNLISGNGENGMFLIGPSLDDTTVEGNLIGVNAAGTAALGNREIGIRMLWATENVRIGGATTGAGNTVSGNARGIYSSASDHAVIQGNRVGTTLSGLSALGNTYVGIVIHDAVSNTIGGVTAAARNIVSGNGLDGIVLYGAGHLVQGNYLGLGADGETPIPNGASGLLLTGVQDVVVGGDLFVGGGNRISANGAFGIHVMHSSDCEFIGNWIGGHPMGAGFGGNDGRGIFITGNSSNNLVGGDIWSRGNVIAYNEGAGVAVGHSIHNVNAVGNRIDWNWIHHNHGLGIDLGSDGPTANDTVPGGDPDVGPNNLQNFPVITNVVDACGYVRLRGYLKSGLSQSYKLNFYGNVQFDPSGYGEGQIMLGSTNVNTAPLDTAAFDLTFTSPDPMPDYYSATATHIGRGDTSEFSHFGMLDTDGDGMPDGYERIHYGDPTGGDPMGDEDGDGESNLAEFIADTNPFDAEDYLRLTNVGRDAALPDDIVWAEFSSSRYRHYRLEYASAEELVGGEWRFGAMGVQPGTGGDMVMGQPVAGDAANTLLRIRVRLP